LQYFESVYLHGSRRFNREKRSPPPARVGLQLLGARLQHLAQTLEGLRVALRHVVGFVRIELEIEEPRSLQGPDAEAEIGWIAKGHAVAVVILESALADGAQMAHLVEPDRAPRLSLSPAESLDQALTVDHPIGRRWNAEQLQDCRKEVDRNHRILVDARAYSRLPSAKGATARGLVLSVLAGVLMGFFYRFVAASMVSDFRSPEAGRLTPYAAMFVFTLGVFLSNFLWNTFFMYKPVSGTRSTYGEYFSKGSPRLHLIGILGGLIWCFGMTMSLIAAEQAGFAISYGLGQGATMVAAAWGVFIWKEFKDAPEGTGRLLGAMFGLFIVGLGLIIAARLV